VVAGKNKRNYLEEMSARKIEIVDTNDRGFAQDIRFNAMSNKTLAAELEKFLLHHSDKWKMNGDEQGLIGAVAHRLLMYG
jgi:hypothetical protein